LKAKRHRLHGVCSSDFVGRIRAALPLYVVPSIHLNAYYKDGYKDAVRDLHRVLDEEQRRLKSPNADLSHRDPRP
jgi:hypothetical protein